MKKLMLIFVLLIIGVCLVADTVLLKNFEELMEALKSGEQVRVIASYGECQLITDNEIEEHVPNAIGGMNVDTFEYFAPMSIGNPKGFVVFSHTSLINYGGYVYNYAKFKVTDDNKVKITAQYANAENFDIEMDENFFSMMNDGKNEGAVSFYKIK